MGLSEWLTHAHIWSDNLQLPIQRDRRGNAHYGQDGQHGQNGHQGCHGHHGRQGRHGHQGHKFFKALVRVFAKICAITW